MFHPYQSPLRQNQAKQAPHNPRHPTCLAYTRALPSTLGIPTGRHSSATHTMGSLPQQRLYILDTGISHPQNHGAILSCRPDGSDLRTVVGALPHKPDGLGYATGLAGEEKGLTHLGARKGRLSYEVATRVESVAVLLRHTG